LNFVSTSSSTGSMGIGVDLNDEGGKPFPMIYSVNSGQEVDSWRQFAVATIVLLFATAAWPQDSDPDDSPTDAPQLELFDSDVELTRKGWSQFHLAAGFMRLSADGIYSLRFPDGRQLTILTAYAFPMEGNLPSSISTVQDWRIPILRTGLRSTGERLAPAGAPGLPRGDMMPSAPVPGTISWTWATVWSSPWGRP